MRAMTEHKPATCTVRFAVTGACGEPAVWSNGEFAECVKHAHDPAGLARAAAARPGGLRVDDVVEIARHGKRYLGRVCKVGARGAVYAEVTYNNGVTRVVRV